jgi:hypothetical protein
MVLVSRYHRVSTARPNKRGANVVQKLSPSHKCVGVGGHGSVGMACAYFSSMPSLGLVFHLVLSLPLSLNSPHRLSPPFLSEPQGPAQLVGPNGEALSPLMAAAIREPSRPGSPTNAREFWSLPCAQLAPHFTTISATGVARSG